MEEFIWNTLVVGTFMYAIRKIIGDKIVEIIKRSDRRLAIWNHYMGIARGEDGHGGEVLDCHSSRCATL